MKAIKWIVVLAIIAGTAGGIWWWKRRADDAPQYLATAVTRGDLTQLVTATGTLNPVTNVQVGSQISGTIAQLFADYNSSVTGGQVVAQIDSATFQAIVNQAEGDLANARAGLELAQVNAGRSKELFGNKLVPASDYDQARAALHQAEANVQIKTASLEKARVDLSRCTIYSPVDGTVISRSVDVGQTVAASLSAPVLFQIANDLTKMQIDANVAEADVGTVMVDQKVDFTVDAFTGRTFHGSVRQVRNAPLTVQNVVTYDTVIDVNNPDLKLKPGMTANVSIIIASRDDVLKIPNAALRFRLPDAQPAGGGAAKQGAGKKREHSPTRTIYVLDESGKPQPVQIKTGITDGIATEVTEGLKEGDKVVTSSSSRSGAATASKIPFGAGMRRFAAVSAVIQLAKVEKTYHTGEVDVRAVRGVSIDIQKGEFVAIMGASGSGKSTLMNIIGCLDKPTSGHYLLDDIDVSQLGRDALADIRNKKLGFVFQGFNLLSRTSALENVELPMLYTHDHLSPADLHTRALRSLEIVGLAERADHHPNQLSGGQQQRVAIARALVNDPAVLLADEPTGNLDTRTSIEVMGVFQQLNDRGITIVMVTHELDIAAFTKRNIVMRDGLVVSDKPVELRSIAQTELDRLQQAQQAVNLAS